MTGFPSVFTLPTIPFRPREDEEGVPCGQQRSVNHLCFLLVRWAGTGAVVVRSRLIPATATCRRHLPFRSMILACRNLQIFSMCSMAMKCSFLSSVSSAGPSMPRSTFRCCTVLWYRAPLTPSSRLHCFTRAPGSWALIALTISMCCLAALSSWSSGLVSLQYLISTMLYVRCCVS